MENLRIVTEADEYSRVYEQSIFTRPAVYLDDSSNKVVETHKAIVDEDGKTIT